MKYPILAVFLTFLLLLSGCAAPAQSHLPDQAGASIILSLAGDDFASLAQEIGKNEGLQVYTTWEEALSRYPETILWVASPAQLSDARMIEAGLALKSHGMLPSIGLISGKTQADARALWLRGRQVTNDWAKNPPGRFFAANGEFSTAGITGAQLTTFHAGMDQTVPMDLAVLTGALQQADYLTFTGHGSDNYWRLDAETRLLTADLPNLPPLVATSNGCQTMRPWEEDSIAIGFSEKGAAVYGGFVYSPLEGFMTGGFQDLPLRYSWPGFTIGHIAALQNRGTRQGFAAFPFYYLLGDPRLAFQPSPPYTLLSDEEKIGTRILTYYSNSQGFLPVRVTDGAKYHYVDVPGVADTADGDPFFNSDIQAGSLNRDKFVLFRHAGGEFTLRLRENPPIYWWPARVLLASFDHLTLFTPMNGGGWLVAFAGLLSTGIAFLRWNSRRKLGESANRHMLMISLFTGLVITLCLGIYQIRRLPEVSINTKPLSVDIPWLAGVFLFSASGTTLYLLARKWPGRLLAVLIAVFPALLPVVFSLLSVGGINLLIAQRIGAPVYSYQLAGLPFIAGCVWFLLLWLWLRFGKRYLEDGEHNLQIP
ncbi:MAG: hypothetical protein GYA15_06980 [Leptolinea sp.]|jgi:hypothetical protein|nr:hypothetical protein [Leptolinea sp.]